MSPTSATCYQVHQARPQWLGHPWTRWFFLVLEITCINQQICIYIYMYISIIYIYSTSFIHIVIRYMYHTYISSCMYMDICEYSRWNISIEAWCKWSCLCDIFGNSNVNLSIRIHRCYYIHVRGMILCIYIGIQNSVMYNVQPLYKYIYIYILGSQPMVNGSAPRHPMPRFPQEIACHVSPNKIASLMTGDH